MHTDIYYSFNTLEHEIFDECVAHKKKAKQQQTHSSRCMPEHRDGKKSRRFA